VARPAAQQQTQWQSIRDAAREAGFQFPADITDDRQALNFLLQRANNPVSEEDRKFLEGWRTRKRLTDNETLKGIKSIEVYGHMNTAHAGDEAAFIQAVTPDIKSKLRQAGIQVVDSLYAQSDALLGVCVDANWSSDNQVCAWNTVLAVGELTYAVRHGQHYVVPSEIWTSSTVAAAAANQTDGFTRDISWQLTKFLNEWQAANKP